MNCQTTLPISNANPQMQLNNHEDVVTNFINETANRNNSNNAKSQPFKTTQDNDNPKAETEGNKQSPHFLLKVIAIIYYLETTIR